MKDIVAKAGKSDEFVIASCATSTEEIGNPVHYGTKRKLAEVGISCDGKRAVQLTKSDYDRYDYIIAMDEMNIRNIMRIIRSDPENKVSLLLSHAGIGGSIADPWYTGNFDDTYCLSRQELGISSLGGCWLGKSVQDVVVEQALNY